MLLILGVGALLSGSVSSAQTTPLCDEFNGTAVNAETWHIPTWVSPSDGTYVGRTQFRVTQHSPLPNTSDGNAQITVETYNPTGFSFYGYDLISNGTFTAGDGLDFAVRAKMATPEPAGIVGGIFLYALKPGSNTLHNEIDFELLGNDPTSVHTNVYGDEPLGAGHPAATAYASGSATDYHTYEIRWLPTEVSWYVDGNLIRTATTGIPTGPMNVHLNMWAPAADWPEAYSAALQPTSSPAENQTFTMDVDWVHMNDPNGPACVAPAVRVIDLTPPFVLALKSTGRRGHMMRLKYRVSDNSGITRDTITVYRRSQQIKRLSTDFGEANWAKTYYVSWRARRSGTGFRFCVQSWDRARNQSNRSCAPITLRG